jgi:hypothetical protein
MQEMPRFITQLSIFRVFLQISVELIEWDITRKFNRIGLHQVLERRFVDAQEVSLFGDCIFENFMWG